MNRIILLIGFLTYTVLTEAQTSQNSLSLSWGMGHIMRQDLSASPFIHEKWSPTNMLLRYSRTKKLDQLIDVKFSLYKPSIVEPYSFNSYYYGGAQIGLAHSFTLIDINYAIGKSVLERNQWKLVLGGKSRNHIYASNYNFGASGPSPMLISFGLDFWLKLKYTLNDKHYFISNLSIPLFSFIYRDPYLLQDDQFFENIYSHNGLKEFANRVSDGQLQSWGTSQRFDLDVQYGYVINKRWDIGIRYLLAMNFNQSPTRFSQIENVIYISGKIKF